VSKIKFKLPSAISRKKVKITLPVVGLILALVYFFYSTVGVSAAALTGGSLTLSDSQPSATSVSYTLEFDNVTTSAIKCIRVEFDTAADGSGSKPTGMTITGVALGGSSSYIPTPGNWSPSADNGTGVIQITYATGETPASSSDRTVILTGITNGSTAGTGYYALLNT